MKTVTLPFGVMPAGVALAIAIMDVTTHACDIAARTGQTFDDWRCSGGAREREADDRSGAAHAGRVRRREPAPPNATPAEKLLAFAGRKV